MSTTRREKARRLKNAEGVIICSCGCGQIPKPPRQTWFSQACVDGWREKNDPGYIRQQMLKRDKGICALCGVDCVKIQKTVQRLQHLLRCSPPDHGQRKFREGHSYNGQFLRSKYDRCLAIWQRWRHKRITAARNRLERIRAQGWNLDRKTQWDADHILPVIEGGGLCGLVSMQTLCVPCHKEKTKQHAKDRAQRRRESSGCLPDQVPGN
jgi:5-methylcytosine-specific restriction protein A